MARWMVEGAQVLWVTLTSSPESPPNILDQHRKLKKRILRQFGVDYRYVAIQTAEGHGVLHMFWARVDPDGAPRSFYVDQAWLSAAWSELHGAHRWDDPCEAYEHGCSWLSWGFGMRMSFLTALRVSGDLSVHFKECLAVRVALLEEQDGSELLKTKRRDGVTLYAPREVVVWRGGVVDPGWRPVPGRRARRLQRGL